MFINHSQYVALISIESKSFFEIQPHSYVNVPAPNGKNIKIQIQRNVGSYKKSNKFVLELSSVYCFENICDGDELNISSEKIRIDCDNVYYERMFLYNSRNVNFTEKISVIDEEKIKRKYQITKLISFLFFKPIELIPQVVIFSVLLGVVLVWKIGWNAFPIYLLVSYLLLLLLVLIIQKITNGLFKHTRKTAEHKNIFYNYCESDKIGQYYSNPHRVAFLGEIEIN